ncbi:MAG: SH3 domain-containing protein [Spirochaetes bacterium]|nr:SH3 domain-containing protein [Spirochaetota bacterium]
MKKTLLIPLLVLILSLPVLPEIPLGTFSNMEMSPETGDLTGSEITLKKERDGLSGEYTVAMGEKMPPAPLRSINCDEKAGTCSFVFKESGINKECSLLRIKGGAILTCKGERASLLFDNGKRIELPPVDRLCFASGPVYGTKRGDGAVLYTLGQNTRVTLKRLPDDGDSLAEVEHGGKKVFIRGGNLFRTRPGVITGDNVRLRKKPSLDGEIITVFRKGTLVGYMYMENEKWVRVTCRGQIGYIASEFIASD